MIQRMQTVYLAIAGLGGLIQFAFPFIVTDNPSTLITLIPIVALILGVAAIATIFVYKNRSLQALLCTIGTILSVGVMGLGWWTIQNIETGVVIGLAYYIWVALPLGFWLARKGIVRDINLIKSMDKFR